MRAQNNFPRKSLYKAEYTSAAKVPQINYKVRHISKTFQPIFHGVPPVPGSIPVLPATPAFRPGLFTIGPSGLFIISQKSRQKPSVLPVGYSETVRSG
jgi:hypothetical protein